MFLVYCTVIQQVDFFSHFAIFWLVVLGFIMAYVASKQ